MRPRMVHFGRGGVDEHPAFATGRSRGPRPTSPRSRATPRAQRPYPRPQPRGSPIARGPHVIGHRVSLPGREPPAASGRQGCPHSAAEEVAPIVCREDGVEGRGRPLRMPVAPPKGWELHRSSHTRPGPSAEHQRSQDRSRSFLVVFHSQLVSEQGTSQCRENVLRVNLQICSEERRQGSRGAAPATGQRWLQPVEACGESFVGHTICWLTIFSWSASMKPLRRPLPTAVD